MPALGSYTTARALGQIPVRRHFLFGMSDVTTNGLFPSFMTVNVESTSAAAYFLRVPAHAPGRLVSVSIATQLGTPGVTTIGLHIASGGGALGAVATGTTKTVNVAAVDTVYEATFPEGDQIFAKGDEFGIKLTPTASWGNTQGVAIFEFWET